PGGVSPPLPAPADHPDHHAEAADRAHPGEKRPSAGAVREPAAVEFHLITAECAGDALAGYRPALALRITNYLNDLYRWPSRAQPFGAGKVLDPASFVTLLDHQECHV